MPDRKNAQVRRARTLRRGQTEAERRVWRKLRDRRLGGFKFVRQGPIGPFFADFVCRERALVVEIDGATHSTNEELASDARRTAFLERGGFRVLRFTNAEVYDNSDGVLETILAALGASEAFVDGPGPPHPDPLPASGERERPAARASLGACAPPAIPPGPRERVSSPVASRTAQGDGMTAFTLPDLARIVAERGASPPAESYTARLLAAGPAAPAKKLGEEAVEAVIAAVQGDRAALVAEAADVLYHLLVVLRGADVPLDEVMAELERRTSRSGLAEKAARTG